MNRLHAFAKKYNQRAREAREAGFFVGNGKVFDHRPTEAERPVKPICEVMEWKTC